MPRTAGRLFPKADVRTFWSPEAIKRVTGNKLSGLAENGIIHLINSGPAALDGTGQQKDSDGNLKVTEDGEYIGILSRDIEDVDVFIKGE